VDEPAVMECTAQAIVKEIVYMGDTNKFYIQLHNGEELVVKQHNRKGMRQPEKEDSVVIGWDPANCVGLKL
jgi:ABC-type Fe3+/spermidine/putrescine transport system ATPase subunit